MKNITTIIIKIITFPITAIKWIVYVSLTYLLLFTIGFIVDRYIGWPPVVKPIRDSALTITIGIVKKITPPLQKLAKKFETNDQHTHELTKIHEPDNKNTNTPDPEDFTTPTKKKEEVIRNQAQTLYYNLENIPIIQKLTESIDAMKKSIEAMPKKNNTQQKVNWSPNILYGCFTLNILFLLITSYLLYRIIQQQSI